MTATEIESIFGHALANLDFETTKRNFDDNGECVVLTELVDAGLVDQMTRELSPTFWGSRSRLPFIRSASHLGYRWMQRHAPTTTAFYRSPAFLAFMSRLTGKKLELKNPQDDHACATYAYSRERDGMQFHYDTCGCDPGASYTMILGLVDQSSQRLLIDLHREDPKRLRREQVATSPGTLVIFCGSKIWHGVSPLNHGGRRMVLSMSYATEVGMPRRRRLAENVKDAVLYFGPSALWQRNYRGQSK